MIDDFERLQQDIKVAANLSTPEATGWYSLRCPICNNDRKTGGFKFDHDSIGYQCFRASCDSNTTLNRDGFVSRKFRNLMDSIGVQIPISVRLHKKSQISKEMESLDDALYTKHSFKEITLPSDIVPLIKSSSPVAKNWIEYFRSRHCEVEDLFFITDGKYKYNVLLPMFLYGILIGYQVITKKGYLNIGEGNTNVLYVPEGKLDNPSIVVEGTLDAKCFPNTVATLKSKVSKEQAYHLRGKDVILLPDRSGNDFINQFYRYGWKICIPPWKEKDLNAAVIRFGVMVVARMIEDSIYTDKTAAEVAYNIWRKGYK